MWSFLFWGRRKWIDAWVKSYCVLMSLRQLAHSCLKELSYSGIWRDMKVSLNPMEVIFHGMLAALGLRKSCHDQYVLIHFMMTSSNGNIFRVTSHLCREFTGHRPIPRKGQWRGALMFSLICARISSWVRNREAGDLGRHRAHYDVIFNKKNAVCLPPLQDHCHLVSGRDVLNLTFPDDF